MVRLMVRGLHGERDLRCCTVGLANGFETLADEGDLGGEDGGHGFELIEMLREFAEVTLVHEWLLLVDSCNCMESTAWIVPAVSRL